MLATSCPDRPLMGRVNAAATSPAICVIETRNDNARILASEEEEYDSP